MYEFHIEDNNGLPIDAIRRNGTAAQHYAWCVTQAVMSLNKNNYPVTAIQTFRSGMDEREDTRFYVKFKWPWMRENQEKLVIRTITDRANALAGVRSCTITQLEPSEPGITEKLICKN